MGDKHKKKNMKYTKSYRDKIKKHEMDVFANYIQYFAFGNKKHLKRILNIEQNFNMVNSSSNPVHTLSYYIANTIDKGLETKYLHLLVDLMQKKIVLFSVMKKQLKELYVKLLLVMDILLWKD